LHDGFLAGSAATLQPLKVGRDVGATACESIWQHWTPASEGTFELVFVPDVKVFDGRYANNGWLQELPDPLTKLTWDNAVLIGVDAAERLRVETGDLVRLSHGGREITAAALVMPGQHPGSVTLALGYGQALGAVSDGAGFNFYLLRTTDGMGFATGASIDPAGGSYTLAVTQHHHAIDSVAGQGTQKRLPSLFREATLDEYRKNPGFANDHHHTGVHVPHRLSLWEESNLDGARYAWAMSIDLNACTGCSACVVACQAENNIPIVGKDQVKRGREMHWLRVDRYFKGQNPAEPDAAAMQPVPCMMCENAPCEQVCPVAATTHDMDGLNVMIYNRCVGTRYCSNNCPYKVRKFNYFDYAKREPVREGGLLHVKPDYYTRPQTDTNPLRQLQFNPEVTIRSRGVMEKCTYCVQRISAAKIATKNAWVKLSPEAKARDRRVTVPDDSFTTACAQACPAQAIVFGDKNDPASGVTAKFENKRTYQMLEEINTKPRTRYQARIRNASTSLAAADHSVAEPGH
jgi:molybdopterin-containing oxidoreductase family iron-sulfur binding subunit